MAGSGEPLYPVNLVLRGRSVLVVGAGRVAARKIEELLRCGAVVHVVATRVSDAVRALPGITWEERPFQAGDVDGRWLAVTATDVPAVNRAVREAGDAAHLWVNAADDPANCTATLPARLRRGDLLVAVSTSSRAPAVAGWVRAQLEAQIGPEYGEVVDLVAEARGALHAQGRRTEGLDWQTALDSGILDLVRAGRRADAREVLQECLSSSSD